MENLSNKFLNTKTIVECSLFTALIAIGAFIRIPTPITVFTLQFIFVLLSGVVLGSKKSAVSVLSYVLIGIIGFPIFTEGGGPSYILKPTFGYLIAFIFAAFIVGFLIEHTKKTSSLKIFLYCVISMFVTYFIGSFYTYIILNYVMGTNISYLLTFASLFPVIFAKDLISCFIVSTIAIRLRKYSYFNR